MNKSNLLAAIVFGIGLSLLLLVDYIWAQQSLSQQDFENQIMRTLEKQDSTKLNILVRDHPFKLFPIITKLLDNYISEILGGQVDKAQQHLRKAETIARLYQKMYKQDAFTDRLERYQGWSREQMEKKVFVDTLLSQGRGAALQSEFEVAQKAFKEALVISQQIGYLEGECRAMGNIGNVFDEIGRHDSALVYIQSSLQLDQKLADKPGEAKSLSNLATRFWVLHQFADAIRTFKEALALAREVGDRYQEGIVLGNMGATYLTMGNLDSAVTLLEQSLLLAHETKNQIDVGVRLGNLGNLYYKKGDPEKALEYWEQALAIHKKMNNQKDMVIVKVNIGIMNEQFGRIDQAIKYLKEAAETARHIKVFALEVSALRRIVRLQRLIGEHEKCLATLSQILEIQVANGDSVGVCGTLLSLGITHSEISNYNEAEACYNRALNIAKTVDDPEPLLSCHINLGSLYHARSDHARALDADFKALKIARVSKTVDAEITCYNNIGVVYSDLGDIEKSIYYHQQALALNEKIKNKQGIADSKLNLGANYLNWDRLSKADQLQKSRQCFEEALVLCRQTGNKRVAAMCLMNLATIYKLTGNSSKALELLHQAIAIQDTLQDRSYQGVSFYLLAGIFQQLKNDSAAFDNYQKSLTKAQQLGIPGDIWQPQYQIGLILEKQGRENQALTYYTNAINTIESIRSRLQLESFKVGFMENKIGVYESIIKLLVKQGRYQDAFAYSEKAKARALLDALDRSNRDITRGISAELRQQKKHLEQKIISIQEALFSERTQNQTAPDYKKLAMLEKRLLKIRNQYQALLQEIQIHHPQYGQIMGFRAPLRIQEVQQRILSPKTALIEYFVAKDQIIVWTLRPDGSHCESLPITSAELKLLVDSLRQPFRSIKEGKILELSEVNFDLALARKLYDQLIRPIEKQLVSASELIIVPDGVLHYLPFEALITELKTAESSQSVLFSQFEQAHFFIEDYAISYAPSASVLDSRLRRKKKTSPMKGQLLALGNPHFGKFSGREMRAVSDTSAESIRIHLATGGVLAALLHPLPQSEVEVDSIAKLLQPSLVYKGADAKEEYFKHNAAAYQFIHIASHGFADEQQPLYSHVILAQDDDPTEDGFLYAHEVFNISLNAELVTLSACETGLGKFVCGEGLTGLTQAFLYAGAPSLLVSLWSVDESTSLIMKEFYKNLKDGMSKTAALRQAKLKLIRTRESRFSFAHPFLWAPFVLVGEWK